MNSKSTHVWFLIAAVLFALIFLLQPFLHRHAVGLKPLLSGLRPAKITSVKIIPANAPEIHAERIKGAWQLTKPIQYPAQTSAIEGLLRALQLLAPALRFHAGKSNQISNVSAGYGFVHPLTLALQQGTNCWRLLVGHRTAPGDQVYVRVPSMNAVLVVGAGWLKYLPHSADDWRDTALVATDVSNFDWIVITNGPQEVELQRDPTTHLWRMTRPLATWANNAAIADFLQQLQTAHVARFVTDHPTDLDTYGLHPAHLDFWLGDGTNDITALFLGRDATKTATQVFGRRNGYNVVFTTAAPPLSYWWAQVNSFRDPDLLELTTPVSEIQVRGLHNFTLRRCASNDWQLVGENLPVDVQSVRQFIQTLTHLPVASFVKDVVTPADFPLYGLAKPTWQITLFSASGGTNVVIAKLAFGATRNNEVFVRRAGEDSVYAISRANFDRLPEAGWEFRQRRIWDFNGGDVSEITIHQNGQTRSMIHLGPNQWSLAAGSQGIIVPPAIEETAYQLSHLYAATWVAHDVTNSAKYGFKPGSLSLTVKLRGGTDYTVDFGQAIRSETALAAVTLDGERWVFVFPPAAYQLVQSYLTIPPYRT